MKLSILFVAFPSLLFRLVISKNLISEKLSDDKSLSNYVCKITESILTSKTETQDVLIKHFGDQVALSEIDNILECLKDVSAIVVNNYLKLKSRNSLRKAAVMILMLNIVTKDTVRSLVNTHRQSSHKKDFAWHHMGKLIIVILDQKSESMISSLLNEFMDGGYYNVACVHLTKSGYVQVDNFGSLTRRKISNINPHSNKIIFPDKLNNMEGHAYKVPLYSQIPRVIIMKGKIISHLRYFLSLLQNLQNATVNYNIVKGFRNIEYLWHDRSMDLTFNTGVQMITSETEFMTYEENSYCAIIPLPPKMSLFDLIFIKPYDVMTWIFFVITIVVASFVFWMFRGRGAVDSPLLLLCAVFVIFIGQGLDFSRKNRMVLSILIQLIIVMTWVLSNAYEGVITSFMIQPSYDNRLKTFDDLVSSNFKIITSDGVAENMKLSEAYQLLKPRLNTSGPRLGDHFRVELQLARFVFIMNCDEMEILMPATLPYTNIKVSQLYYMLPQKFYPNFIKLSASYLNPYLERLQYYMDFSFQAGLPYVWNVYASLENPYKKTSMEDSDTIGYLKLEDLKQVFSILLVGYVISAIVLIIEVFFRDVIKKFKFSIITRNLRSRVYNMTFKKKRYQVGSFHQWKKPKRLQSKRLNVQKIFVHPKVSSDIRA